MTTKIERTCVWFIQMSELFIYLSIEMMRLGYVCGQLLLYLVFSVSGTGSCWWYHQNLNSNHIESLVDYRECLSFQNLFD